MTEVTTRIPGQAAQQASAARGTAERQATGDDSPGATTISSDFETFLRMLTVQAQNQDPLNPLDSTDFAVQLATFSSVEQQVLTNDLLKGLTNSFGGTELSQLAGWVGMDARAAAPAVFDGNPILIEAAPVSTAARAELRVFDQNGQLWDQLDIGVQSGPLIWEGVRADGTTFPEGLYTFEITSLDEEGGVRATDLAETYNRVVEVQIGPDGAELLLGNGTYVTADAISALRKPAPDISANVAET